MQTLQQRQTDISIIVPVYNLEKYIEPLLDSLKAQELGPYTMEVIMVLNNCTDHSQDVIRGSGLDCTIVNCSKQGIGPARNMGFDLSSGEFVWFIDGDDWLTTPTAVREVLDAMHTHGHNMIRIPFTSNGFGGSWYSMVWQYVFRRDYVDGIRYTDRMPGEDGDYMDAVFEKAGRTRNYYNRMPHLNRALYFYNYPREGSVMYKFFGRDK